MADCGADGGQHAGDAPIDQPVPREDRDEERKHAHEVRSVLQRQLAFAEVGHAWISWRPHVLSWWITALNMVGSIAFGVSAIAAYVVPVAGWRRKDDISWRASTWELRRLALGGMLLKPDEGGLRVEHVGQYAPHDRAKRFFRNDFRQHHVIVRGHRREAPQSVPAQRHAHHAWRHAGGPHDVRLAQHHRSRTDLAYGCRGVRHRKIFPIRRIRPAMKPGCAG